VRRLAESKYIALFPEGTRSRDGTIQELKPGAILLARRLRRPIIPVFLDGFFDAWPPGRFLPRPRHLHLRFGEPIDVTDPTGRRLTVDELRHSLMSLAET